MPGFFSPIRYPTQVISLRSLAVSILCLYNYPEKWHHLMILQLVWTFLTPRCSRWKSCFSWILTYMKEVVLPILPQGSKIVSVYMVCLQGMSHLLEINVINAFYQKFETTLVNFLGFLLLTSKKRKALRF